MNRLAAETSPYLLQHADNPVDWYAWGDEAFERARTEDRPVLLSVGYAACHWCHVMEHESFESTEIAGLMNENFVNVKVDREERPDVDGLYMDAVVAMTGQGGWPMTVFLTPEGKPFFGGTYFPPEPRRGMPSFPQVLQAVAEAYRSRRSDLERQAETLVDAIRQASERPPSGEPLTPALLAGAAPALRRLFDPVEGGFGPAPKFPAASTIDLLLRLHAGDAPGEPLEMATLTLDHMAAGGMYDVLGGGFHRYAVDARWLVPHFEKMLYDNALLVSAYLHAWTVTGEERYRRVVAETLDYLLRELRLPEGGLASAQDADTDGVEGLTYTWTPDELEAALGEPHPEWLQPFEHGRSVLRGDVPEEVRETLLAVRAARPQPLRDDKVLAGWNGLALAALAEAAARLGRPDWLEAAVALGRFLLGPLSDERGRLLRTYRDGEARIPAYLEDYANVANGLVELAWATGEPRWLEEARRLAGLMTGLFGDEERGGFYVDAADGTGLVARRKEFDDHPTPAGNSMAAFVLLRLARVYGDDDLERRAVGVFRLALPLMERAPGAVPHLLAALDLHFSPPHEVAVVGDSPDLRAEALAGFRPNTVFAFASEPTDAVPLLAGKDLVDGRPAAYVCERFACRRPVTSAEELRGLLAGRPA
ncbi:MAG TPA: thioredoxin domain-containing protein [Gaiellaceae bacterium]|nr:thioredoxin domain-containing protein [Gaiellaceae bacterium]